MIKTRHTKSKEETIYTYKNKKLVKSFDSERRKYLFQRHKHKTEADFLKKAIMEIGKNKIKILDVACGTGRMMPEVFSTGKDIEYYGLDTSKEMLGELKKRAKYIKGKKIFVKTGDATKIPFKKNSFDIVYSFHLLWHIEKKEQEKVIKEMLRVTKPKGFIIFDVLNKNFLWEKIKRFLGKRTEGLYKINMKEAGKILGKKEIKTKKLSDAPIKNDFFYSIFNIVNKAEFLLPQSLYHMIYVRVKK